jgi:hypothetical protein
MRHQKTREAGQEKVMSLGGLQCPFCYKYFISLGNHVTASHDMTAKQFRLHMGYRHDHSLVADFKREEYRQRGLENVKHQPSDLIQRMHKSNHHPKYIISREGKSDKTKNRNPRYTEKMCLQCGKTFNAKYFLRDKVKYCSRKCSNKNYERHRTK